jgi:hypothetical protein
VTRDDQVAALRCTAAIVLVIAAALIARAEAPPSTDWRPFDGSWSASGDRQMLPTESGRPAAVVHLSGAVVLANGTGIAAGFTAEAIGFDDGGGVTTGRAVWTDSAGDRIFSRLRGGALEAGRRISGTITDGTGRWSGVVGDYELTWQYVVSAEGTSVQGRTSDLRGRLRWRGTP